MKSFIEFYKSSEIDREKMKSFIEFYKSSVIDRKNEEFHRIL